MTISDQFENSDSANAYSGEELITLEPLGPWQRVAHGVDGALRLTSIVFGGARALCGARAWRAARCTWNPLTVCFVAGPQVVVGEIVEDMPDHLSLWHETTAMDPHPLSPHTPERFQDLGKKSSSGKLATMRCAFMTKRRSWRVRIMWT